MKTLKTYFESLLDKTSKKLDGAKKLVDTETKQFCNNLKQIHGRTYATEIDDDLAQEIQDWLTEIPSEDKQGKQWALFIPNADSSFKPICVSYKHCVWRYANTKDICNATDSAIEKRLKTYIKSIQDYSELMITSFGNVSKFWFMINYDKVYSISGSGWITLAEISACNKPYTMISFNMDKKVWCYGCPNGRVPDEFRVGTYSVKREWVDLGNALLYEPTIDGGCHFLSEKSFTQVKNFLSHGSVDSYKKSPNDWVEIGVCRNGLQVNYRVYINKKDLSYLTQNDITLSDPKIIKSYEQELDRLSKGVGGIISDETMDYIHKNFKEVNSNDTIGRTWVTVRRKTGDSKYGRIKVSVKTKEWRGLSFDEFYGGGIVD